MSAPEPRAEAAEHICPKCSTANNESQLSHADYRCSRCGFELAYLDVAPNGVIRGIFGWLRGVDDTIQERYRVREVLGKGGFGATYLVEDLRLSGKRRALKEVPELLFDEYEVNLLSQLSHPAIPDIIDRIAVDKMVYLVLEFGGSRTLGSECRRLGGRIPLKTLLPWLHQLCEALNYLHSQTPPIIHRDLKPDNILLDEHDRVMLIDFGIAKESQPDTTTRLLARSASYGFSPPEQVLGTGTDERSDIYALAATVYYLLTGKVPPAAHERVAGKVLKSPSEIVPGLPPELDDLLLRALNLNLNLRPQTVRDMEQAFDALRGDDAVGQRVSRTTRLDPSVPSVRTYPPGTPPQGIRITTGEVITSATTGEKPAPPKRTSWALPALALSIMLAGALAAGGYYYWRLKPEPKPPVAKIEEPATTPAPAVETKTSGVTPAQPSPAEKPVAVVKPPAPPPEIALPEEALTPSTFIPDTTPIEPEEPLTDAEPAPPPVETAPSTTPSTLSPAPTFTTIPLSPLEPAVTPQASVAPQPSSSAMEAFENLRKDLSDEPAVIPSSPPDSGSQTPQSSSPSRQQASRPEPAPARPPRQVREEKKPEQPPQVIFKPFQTIKTD